MNIDEITKRWKLGNVENIAKTPTSHVFKVKKNAQTLILKVYTDLGRNCESDAPYFFEACKGYNVVDIVTYDDDAMLIEYVSGLTLKHWMADSTDDQATKIIGQTLKSLHAAPQKYSHNFETLNRRFKALFDHAEKDSPAIVKRAAKFARIMLKNQNNIRLLHGDMHHENLLQKNDEWIAIDPQPLIGDRAYDCANTLHNPPQMPELTENENRLLKQAEILSQETGIQAQKIIDFAFIHGCLSACWSEDDKTDTFSRSLAIKTSEILEAHISKNLRASAPICG